MTAATKATAIIKVFSDNGVDVELHAEHDILMFCETDDEVSFKDALEEAGAFYSTEYGCWAMWCRS